MTSVREVIIMILMVVNMRVRSKGAWTVNAQFMSMAEYSICGNEERRALWKKVILGEQAAERCF